jgi:hypothetical protein
LKSIKNINLNFLKKYIFFKCTQTQLQMQYQTGIHTVVWQTTRERWEGHFLLWVFSIYTPLYFWLLIFLDLLPSSTLFLSLSFFFFNLFFHLYPLVAWRGPRILGLFWSLFSCMIIVSLAIFFLWFSFYFDFFKFFYF